MVFEWRHLVCERDLSGERRKSDIFMGEDRARPAASC